MRVDRRADMAKKIVDFRSFANAPKTLRVFLNRVFRDEVQLLRILGLFGYGL